MQKTKIEYLTHTWNPIAMCCTPVSAGCANCWHLRMAHRMAFNHNTISLTRAGAYGGGNPILVEDELSAPLRLRKPARIGVQFMGDLFHENITNEMISKIVCKMTVAIKHTFFILTKRPERMFKFYTHPQPWPTAKLPNVWLGVSVEDQKTADERIPLLLQTPAAHRWVSYEPALGPVDFTALAHEENFTRRDGKWTLFSNALTGERSTSPYSGVTGPKLDWLVMGGETGSRARPMHPDWARSVRDQCHAAGTPLFFKSWGEHSWEIKHKNLLNGTPCINEKEYRQMPKDNL